MEVGAPSVVFAIPECRVSARDTCRGLLLPTGLAQWRQPCCAPVRPAPDRSSATSSARGRPRAAHRPYANGLTAFRMRSACCLRSFGTIAPSPLRQHARAYTYRGLPAFAFALHGRQRVPPAPGQCRGQRSASRRRRRWSLWVPFSHGRSRSPFASFSPGVPHGDRGPLIPAPR